MANTLDELMRDAAKVLKGPHDRRIEDIVTYMRQERAKADMGRKAKRSQTTEEEVSPRIMEAFKKMLPKKKVYRRF